MVKSQRGSSSAGSSHVVLHDLHSSRIAVPTRPVAWLWGGTVSIDDILGKYLGKYRGK